MLINDDILELQRKGDDFHVEIKILSMPYN